MDKASLINQKLHVICLTSSKLPFLMNDDFFILYSDFNDAFDFAGRLSLRYDKTLDESSNFAGKFQAIQIENNAEFFENMIKLGFVRFMYDGGGQILNLNNILNPGTKYNPHSTTGGLVRLCAQQKQIGSLSFNSKSTFKAHITQLEKTICERKFYSLENYYTDEDEKTWYMLFTDRNAAAKYLNIPIDDVSKKTVSPAELYSELKDSDKFFGFVINPGKEHLVIQAMVVWSAAISSGYITLDKTAQTQPQKQTLANVAVAAPEIKSTQPEKEETEVIKKNRPVAAVLMFIFAFFGYALAAVSQDDVSMILFFGLSALGHIALGIALLKKYLKGFWLLILPIIFFSFAVSTVYSNASDIASAVVLFIMYALIAFPFLLIFCLWNFRKKKSDANGDGK